MLPRDKTYYFQRTEIDETSKILKLECKNLPQTYFMDLDEDSVKNDMVLNDNFYYKYFLHLVEIGNENFSKSIFSL